MLRPTLIVQRWKTDVRTLLAYMDGNQWHQKPLGVFLLYVFLALLAVWELHIPSPGYSVTALGVAAAVMAVWGEMTGLEKLAWIFLLFGFMSLELSSVNKERVENEQIRSAARAQEAQDFAGIGDGIKLAINNSQQEFAASTQKSDAIMGKVVDSINSQTGGDSFAFVTFTAQPAQAFEMHWNKFLAPKGEPYFVVSATSHGKYPLRGPHAIMMDDERRLAAMREYNKRPNGDWIEAINSADSEYQIPDLRPQSAEAPQGEVKVIALYPMLAGDSKKLTIHFSASNGYWNELLHLGRLNGNWHQCLSVLGPTVKQAEHPFIYCDSDWPEGKKLAEKDWLFTKQEKQ